MAIEVESFLTPWHKDSFIDVLNRPGAIFLAAHDERHVVGYALSWVVADELHILKLAVQEDFRRQGCGVLLLQVMIKQARREEVEVAWLEVRPSNAAALALYKAHGFQTAYVRRNYYQDNGEDAVILVRRFTGGNN